MDYPGLLLLLAIGLVLFWLVLVVHTMWMLTHPPRRTYAWAVARSLPGTPDEMRVPDGVGGEVEARGLRYEEWTFRSARTGRDLPVWDIAGLDPKGPLIVLTHGWGDSRVVMLGSGRVAALVRRASRLILWDMPGHGEARGMCTLGEGEARDLGVLLDSLRGADEQAGDPPAAPLVLHGFSLGAVVSLRIAADPACRQRIAGIIAEAPYAAPWTPAKNVLRFRGLPYRATLPPAMVLLGLALGKGLAWLPRRGPLHGFAGADGDPPPTLLLHGDADAISPIEDSRWLAEQRPAATLAAIPGGEHQTLWSRQGTAEPAAEAVDRFLRSLGGRSDRGRIVE